MTKAEALAMLEQAPKGDKPSRINPALTMTQAVDVVTKGIQAQTFYKDTLDRLTELRVYQVCRNQKRPSY